VAKSSRENASVLVGAHAITSASASSTAADATTPVDLIFNTLLPVNSG
jgi:hypothetical protein